MTNPLPSRGVTVPPEILYCPKIAPAVRDTWVQLRALANGSAKVKFDGGIAQAASITSKSTQTVYGHLAVLRGLKALSFFSSGGVLFVTFDDKGFLDNLSKILDASISLINNDQNNLNDQTLKEEAASKILEKHRDPSLQHPAVKLYRSVMHLTANHIQREAIIKDVGLELDQWSACLVHWAGHGWSPTNVSGMINSFQTKSWETCGLCKRTPSSRKTSPAKDTDFHRYTEGHYADYIISPEDQEETLG